MVTWQEVAAKIAELAPIAGATLGGPLGAGVGIAIKALAGVFGISSPSPQPEQVMAVISGDPQAVLKLEQARMTYELEKTKIGLEELKTLQQEGLHVQELQTKTIPWVDALHKMGRQIMSYVAVAYCVYAAYAHHSITEIEMIIIAGPNVAYQLIKGAGNKAK